jgi:hypothetical protein
MSVREALSADGGIEELAALLEVRYHVLPAGIKIGLILKGVPSIWQAILHPSGEVIKEGIHPDTQLLYGFVGPPLGWGEAERMIGDSHHAVDPL